MQAGRKAKILVVDDVPQNVLLLEAILTTDGYIVDTARDGEEALLKVSKEQPDLILIDVMMPKLNGYDVCARLKEYEGTRLIPIILTTPPLRGEERVRAITSGSDDLLEKPINQVELLARVKSLVQTKQLNDQLISLEGAIMALAVAVEAKDPYTEEHLKRVVGHAVSLGKEVGLSGEEQRLLRKGAILHDVGKIGIRESILLKRGPLSKEEFEEIKIHPILGERICLPLGVKSISEVVRYHHERYDGKGYPDGLAGEQIPLLARIMALADSYDAITSERPYRKRLPPEEALNELRRQAGKQFDPHLTLIFVSMIETGRQRHSS